MAALAAEWRALFLSGRFSPAEAWSDQVCPEAFICTSALALRRP
jgi:hypothetical protein